MIELKDIEKLASLARMEVGEEEKVKLQKDLEAILAYVSELKDAPQPEEAGAEPYLKNVLRPDTEPYLPGEFTEAILAEAPNQAEGYFKVKKIFN
ncbi:MAG: aspartyl/glutamyl-tRNA amidotransferase subunit C [Candidatus Vogelbacteria bacterium]|nr:aspartyl/glutamyl-tRNA amidotransferase subunit C [Candidatus Vogelbacteria bacterium]